MLNDSHHHHQGGGRPLTEGLQMPGSKALSEGRVAHPTPTFLNSYFTLFSDLQPCCYASIFSFSALIFIRGPSYGQPLWFSGNHQPWTPPLQRSVPLAGTTFFPTLPCPRLTPQTQLEPTSHFHLLTHRGMSFIRLLAKYSTKSGCGRGSHIYKTETKAFP